MFIQVVLFAVIAALFPATIKASPPGPQARAAAFYRAVEVGDTKAVHVLLGRDPRLVATRNARGYAPLHIAVVNEHADIVALLLGKGADANAVVASSGYTPLEEAAINDNLEITKLLLAHGARVNIHDRRGRTALWWAQRDDMPPSSQIAALLRAHAARRSH